MKYTIRAVKYFLTMSLLVLVILGALNWYATGTLDISRSLDQGWTSLLWIALILVAFSAAYPAFGYRERPLDIRGGQEELRRLIKEYMVQHQYRLEQEDADGRMTFRQRAFPARLLKVWEDRVTFTPTHSGYTIEGLNRDIVRYLNGIEYKFQNQDIQTR